MSDSAPRDASEAVDLLLRGCPELQTAWNELCRWTEATNGNDVGIYVVIGQMVLPLIVYASVASHPDEHGNRTRNTLRGEQEWREMPDRGSKELESLLGRLYEWIDLCAASPNLVDAIYIEFIETGYSDLTSAELVAPGGPALKALAEARAP